jgi:hypothetical protein
MIAVLDNEKGDQFMLALVVPVIFIAVLAVLALGISSLCVECVLRMIGRGLGDGSIEQPQSIQGFARPMFDRSERVEQSNTSGLRPIPIR